MGQTISLTAADGHRLTAYRADPAGAQRGGLVVIQEIFGVNDHIRGVCDAFADDGYRVVAPALFDRAEPGIALAYDADGMTRGRAFKAELGWDGPLADVAAAVAALKNDGPVAVVGYCWGGSVAWLAATRLAGLACVVGYYGGQIVDFKDETPRCPVLLHFGETDAAIPLAAVEAIRAAHPEIPVHLYPGAGHGFNCEPRADYHPESARLARERTMAFLARHIGAC